MSVFQAIINALMGMAQWVVQAIWDMLWYVIDGFWEHCYGLLDAILGDVSWLPPLTAFEDLKHSVEVANMWVPIDLVVAMVPGWLAFEAALFVFNRFRAALGVA